jgi:hypothetical protein
MKWLMSPVAIRGAHVVAVVRLAGIVRDLAQPTVYTVRGASPRGEALSLW